MSKCISVSGEYSEHESDENFGCRLCFAFDEDAALARIRELEGALAALSHPIAPLAASDLSDEELLLAVDKHTDGKITDLELVEAAERWRHSARAVAALTTPEGQKHD